MGDSPLKNWMGSTKDCTMKRTRSLDPDLFLAREKKRYHCYSCPLGCGAICEMSGKYKETHRPEYETVLALGNLCMNEDIESIFQLNEILNRAGMDSISAGGTAAFAIECYENGIITREDTGGIELKWGHFDSIVKLIEMMINRDGIGDILADGVKAASRKIGRSSENYAMHAGGQELPMHDGRNDPGFALHYSVEAAPGRHTIGSLLYYDMYQMWKVIKSLPSSPMINLKKSRYNLKDKAVKAAACSQLANIMNGFGLCMFGMFIGVKRLKLFDALNAATGWIYSPEEYMEIGARIQTLKQAFNVMQGVDPRSLRPNRRTLGEPPMEAGMNKGRTVPLDKLVEEYYGQFGWDRTTGKPDPAVIRSFRI
ncbi:MAG: aldehyde ferredoxin oxidoreductase C-terminal domain-containing protein [Spirochaetes bacterium]|nr:aldehyde ferredoxin oxidoreductase C-terminal domain-containing protein [Spirochaetota bacterium]